MPETTDFVSLPDHQNLAVLADNKDLRDSLLKGSPPKPEFFRIPIEEGKIELDAYMIHPPSFDPERKYPVLFHVYGEPAMQVVRDIWGGRTSLWHTMLAQQGYVVVSVDNRGTPSPRGREWRKCIYQQIGINPKRSGGCCTSSTEFSSIFGWEPSGNLGLEWRRLDVLKCNFQVSRPLP